MTTFRVIPGQSSTHGRIVYRGEDFAFDSEPRPTGCVSSVSINELELMLDEEGHEVVFATGYCPHPGWQASTLNRPVSVPGKLVAMLDREAIPGTSISLNEDERWPVRADRSTGWVRLGKGDPAEDPAGVEFAPGAVATFVNNRLVALWLHPETFPDLPNRSPNTK